MRQAHFNDLKQDLLDNHRNVLGSYPQDYREVASKAIDDCIQTIGDYLEQLKQSKQK